jgi:uncharacterized protein YbjT (DUF2867 family)
VKVLVIGAYGLIGSAIARALVLNGHQVGGLGRNVQLAERLLPDLTWHHADLAHMTDVEAWTDILATYQVVINASGGLQDGPDMNLVQVQDRAIRAALVASERAGVLRFIQISAPGANSQAQTDFYTTKAVADAAVLASALDGYVLRPGLVLARGAYGGSSLLRMLAAVPWVQPIVLADRLVQTVSLDDVVRAVLMAVHGDIPAGDYDLMEDTPHSLQELVVSLRLWLGFGPPVLIIHGPDALAKAIAPLADLAGLFGWRSPLRSNALATLKAGITGDSTRWRAAGGHALSGLHTTLAHMPATLQERIFARWALLMPMTLVALSLFWLSSGVIGLFRIDAAMRVLPLGWPDWLKLGAVGMGGVLDIGLGVLILFKRWVRLACGGMIALSFSYLFMASMFVPALWLDPLGPLVKVVPTLVLALVVAALSEER